MFLENFCPQSFDKMVRTRGNKEPSDDSQVGDQAEFKTADGPDPALA